MFRRVAVAVVAILAAACGGSERTGELSAPVPQPRRTVMWVDGRGVDEITAAELARVGVDQIVVPRGAIDLAGEAPVLRFEPKPPLARGLPVGFLFVVQGARPDLADRTAESVWRAVLAEEGGVPPAEIVLDLPDLPDGIADFVGRLVAAAAVPVVPLVTADQLGEAEALEVAAAAGRCLVPGYGTGSADLRRGGRRGTLPLAKDLEPLVGSGVSVRIGIVLSPVVQPSLAGWGDDLNPLTEPDNAEVRTSSELDRTFVIRRPLEWSGRAWAPGEEVAIRWWDAARLHANLAEIDRLVLPDVVGWDLIPLPPPGSRLGISEETLLGYLGGHGPAPTVRVDVARSGSTVRAKVVNDGAFTTAVSGVGNWIEIAASQGAVVVSDRGSFDAIELGSRRSGGWQTQVGGVADAVRFHENYLGPYEELATGPIRLSVSRSEVRVRWHLLLSSGEQVTGELTR
jgi:hypothetical protein